jgi:hypothetical protein
MSDQVDTQQEEKEAFWKWWNETGHTALLKPDGPLMLDVWLAGIEWARAEERSMHDTPEV